MNLTIIKEPTTQLWFSDVVIGEIFEHCGNTYLKMALDEHPKNNVFNFNSQRLEYLYSYSAIRKYKRARLTLE